MRKRIAAVSALGLLTSGLLLGLGIRTLRAAGIPDSTPLYYTGTLLENGAPVTGSRSIAINLWGDGTTQGTPLCETVATVNVSNGLFRVPLSTGCKAAINQNNNAWVEVIDGANSVGRSKIGAVPYAVEADHASRASALVDGGSGGLLFFSVPGATLATPCIVNSGTSIVDCSCPSGTFVVSGGVDCGGTNHPREDRPISTTTWRLTCSNGSADVMGSTYNVICSNLGP